MYFDVTFGGFSYPKWLFVPRTVPKNFWVRNSTLTVTIFDLHSSLSKLKVGFFFCRNQGGGFPHEQALAVENPRSHQMMLDYFYGQSGELFSYFRIPKALFQDHRFRQLSTDARTLYGILLDRMSLSVKNGWLQSGKYRNPSAAPSTRRSSCSGNWRTSTSSSANAVVWADPA